MKRTHIRNRVKSFLTSEKPCAFLEYYEWFKMDRMIENKKYELITLNQTHNQLQYLELRDSEVKLFRENMWRFRLHTDSQHGKVWDKGNFKELIDLKKPKK
jgi:hypothetical protein